MRRQQHKTPLFDRKVKFETKDRWGNKQQKEYVRQGRINNVIRRIGLYLSGLFKPSKKIQALDLRSDPSRGHGAEYLRSLWPALRNMKMVSTRDGRPV
jgi:hypothetical protein